MNNNKRKPDEEPVEDRHTSGLYQIVVFHKDQSVVWKHAQKHYLTLNTEECSLLRNSLIGDPSPSFSTGKTLQVNVLEQAIDEKETVVHQLRGTFEFQVPTRFQSDKWNKSGKFKLCGEMCDYEVQVVTAAEGKDVRVNCVRVEVPQKRAIKFQRV